ncbi:MAG: zinc ribbon domain-containing protein [Synergistaceae bacterium]|nr:zinc ribbon domain-containing protein [Synergistaceae bacterium]
MLIKCPECNAEVSDSALKCPQCGKQLRKPKRGLFGKIFLWLFYLFNIFMLIWLVGGMNAASTSMNSMASEAERAGAAIGTGIGATIIIFIWAIGDVITGLLALMTRPKS